MDGEFSVHQFFPDGDSERVLSGVDPETAIYRAKALMESVGGRIGSTRRVIVADGAGFTVFEWKFGAGITFPTREDIAEWKRANEQT
jgi:hypothetical protein